MNGSAYELNVVFPPKFICRNPNTQYVGIWG